METSDHTVKPTRIMECVCESEYQDKRYGKHKRVMNPAKEKTYRCTVCGRVHDQKGQ